MKKISSIEKKMAQNYFECETLKDCFHTCRSKKSFKCNLKLNKKKHSKKIPSVSLLKYPALLTETTSIISLIIDQLAYTPPSNNSYFKPKINSYIRDPNRQPLPRSSYKKDFLSYGTLPIYAHEPLSDYTNQPLVQKKISSYQAEFQEKKISITEPKDLNCQVDKIK